MKQVSLLAVVLAASCITTVNPVTFKRETGAPTLPERADGCAVEIYEDGQTPERAHKILGRAELSWSATQMKEQGPEYAMKTLRTAVCENGGHYLVNMRALPRGFNEGMLYEGDVAVLVDEQGEPITGQATGTSVSHDGSSLSDAPSDGAATSP